MSPEAAAVFMDNVGGGANLHKSRLKRITAAQTADEPRDTTAVRQGLSRLLRDVYICDLS